MQKQKSDQRETSVRNSPDLTGAREASYGGPRAAV